MLETQVSQRLRILRAKTGKTQDQVSEACNISKIALARYETGTRTPRIEIASKLAEYYHVSVDYILGRDVAESNPPTDPVESQRDEAIRILKSLSDENYQAMLTILRTMVDKKK